MHLAQDTWPKLIDGLERGEGQGEWYMPDSSE